MKKKFNGLWLFGLSGSGKSYLSKKISTLIDNSFIVDGDFVRSKISFDLGYSKKDRIIQNKRVLGIAKMVIKNNYFPIISSVYLDKNVAILAKKNKIKIINILIKNDEKNNIKLKSKKNVVGRSIRQPSVACDKFINNFKKGIDIKQYVKKNIFR